MIPEAAGLRDHSSAPRAPLAGPWVAWVDAAAMTGSWEDRSGGSAGEAPARPGQAGGQGEGHARPWRSIIALVLAVAAAVVSFTAGDITSEQPLERVIAIAAVLVFGLLAVIAVVGFASKSRDVMQPVTGRAHAAVVRHTIVLVGSIAVLFITLGLLDVPIDQLLVGGAVTSIILGIAAQQSLGNVFSGLVLLLSHCTASELDAGSVSCGLAGSAGWGKIAVRVCPPAVLDHDPALRVAGPPWGAARRPRRWRSWSCVTR